MYYFLKKYESHKCAYYVWNIFLRNIFIYLKNKNNYTRTWKNGPFDIFKTDILNTFIKKMLELLRVILGVLFWLGKIDFGTTLWGTFIDNISIINIKFD